MSRQTGMCGGMLLAIGLGLSAGTLCVAQAIRSEPVNPAWTQYLEALRRQAARPMTADGYFLGHVPAPFLHLGAERIRPTGVPRIGLPAAFDLRSIPGKVPVVRNQLGAGTCWAFACLASLETCLRPADTFDGSENNLKNTHGFDRAWNAGGNPDMATAYFARWSGPVSERDDPYNPVSGVSPPHLACRRHVQDVLFLPARTSKTDDDLIKQTIMTHGAVVLAMYYDTRSYNPTTHAYYVASPKSANHDVAAIGWSNKYPASSFRRTPPGNGAFLIRNSFGPDWGDAGYFWLSYYDASIECGEPQNRQLQCFNDTEPPTDYATEYSYDPFGWVTSIGWGTNVCWYANVFSKRAQAEQLRAVSTYATAPNTSYVIRIYRNPAGGPVSSGLGNLDQKLFPLAVSAPSRPVAGAAVYTQTGTFTYAGFHTVVLTTPMRLQASDTSFSVVFKCTNAGYTSLVPVERKVAGYTSGASASPGQSYIGDDGAAWTDLTDAFDPTANCCLKAYTTPVRQATTNRVSGQVALTGLTATPSWQSVVVTFALSAPATVQVRVLNVAGRLIRTVTPGMAGAEGLNTVTWTGLSDSGLQAPNGRYLVEVRAATESGTQSRAMAAMQIAR